MDCRAQKGGFMTSEENISLFADIYRAVLNVTKDKEQARLAALYVVRIAEDLEASQ